MGKIWDFLATNSWEEYQRVQLYKKLGKKLEPEEQPKKMGFGEAMANLGVVMAQSKQKAEQKRDRENKGNIRYVDGKGNIKSISIQKGKRNKRKSIIHEFTRNLIFPFHKRERENLPISKPKKNQKVYHLTKKELDRIIKNAKKKRK